MKKYIPLMCRRTKKSSTQMSLRIARSVGLHSGDFAAVTFVRVPFRGESLAVLFAGDDIEQDCGEVAM